QAHRGPRVHPGRDDPGGPGRHDHRDSDAEPHIAEARVVAAGRTPEVVLQTGRATHSATSSYVDFGRGRRRIRSRPRARTTALGAGQAPGTGEVRGGRQYDVRGRQRHLV